MISITATSCVVVCGTFQAWSLEPDGAGVSREVELVLRIKGDERDGFHFCMRPVGFFEADCWFATLAEAKQEAGTTFGVLEADWFES